MPLRLTTAKLVGNPDESGWSQVHTFTPDSKDKKDKRGILISIFSTSGIGEGLEAVGVGREILSRFHEEYYESLEGGALKRLEEASKKVAEEFTSKQVDLEILSAVYLGSVLYFVIFGEGAVYIFRSGKLGRIVQGKKAEVVSASGRPEAYDLFALSTSQFFSVSDIKTLTAALSTGSAQAAVELLAPAIHAKDQNSRISLVTIGFEPEAQTAPVVSRAPYVLPKEDVKQTVLERVKKGLRDFLVTVIDALLKVIPQKPVYLHKDDEGKRRRTVIFVGVLLIIILLTSVVFGSKAKRDREIRATYESDLIAAQDGFKEALALKDISEERSREIAISVLDKVRDLESRKVRDERLEELKKDLQVLYKEVLGEYSPELSVFIDLTFLTADFTASELAASPGTLGVLDKAKNRLVTFSLSSKSPQIRGGPEALGNVSSIALYVERVFVFSDRGILEIDKSGESKVVVEADSASGEMAGLASYAGNLYLLDRAGDVWRYPVVEGGFGARQRWLGAGVIPDFSDAVDFSIDGAIWVLKKGGKVEKYALGSPDNFLLSGASPPLGEATRVFTNEDSQSIYFLEPLRSRIVAFDKKGSYRAQYKWEGVGDALDFAVSEGDGKIFILTGDKIYEFSLNGGDGGI